MITRTEYINEDKIKSIRDNKAGFALGVRYDNYSIPFNPSLEFNYTYPNRIWTGLSGCIIRDPLIHTIALHYTPKAKNQSQELSLLQSLAFLANDRTSLRVSLVSLLTDRQLPSISSITFSASYSLDPDKTILLLSHFAFSDSGMAYIGTSHILTKKEALPVAASLLASNFSMLPLKCAKIRTFDLEGMLEIF